MEPLAPAPRPPPLIAALRPLVLVSLAVLAGALVGVLARAAP
jgi:hypothetical protein